MNPDEVMKTRRPRKPQSRLPAALAVVESHPEIVYNLVGLLDSPNLACEVVVDAMAAEARRHTDEMSNLRAQRSFAEALASLTETEKRHLRGTLAEIGGTQG